MALELLFTGADTNPQTLATALTTFQATLPPAWLLSVGTSNTTIAELAKYIVSSFMYPLTIDSLHSWAVKALDTIDVYCCFLKCHSPVLFFEKVASAQAVLGVAS